MNNIDFTKYLDSLINKIWKLLPMLDENRDEAKKYLNTNLLIQVRGAVELFENDEYMVTILAFLEGIKNNTDYNIWRKTIFDCLNQINKLIQKYSKKER